MHQLFNQIKINISTFDKENVIQLYIINIHLQISNLSTMKQQDTLNMHLLLQICCNLTLQACTIVKDCYQNKDVKKYEKGVNDPVTEADFKVQTMLIRGIRKYFPAINIVGEQNVDYEGEITTKYDNLEQIKLPSSLVFKNQYQMNEICLWIDPIDNTRGFIQGEAQAVTVLIGISYQGLSEVGIIGIPFKKYQNETIFKPSVLIGCATSKFSYELNGSTKQWNSLKSPQTGPKEHPIVVMSPTRKNVIQKKVSEKINGQILLAGGSGYKSALIIKGQADVFAYCESFTKKWDSCAGEAIIKSLNGYFIDGNSNNLNYDSKSSSYTNGNGIICGFIPQYKQIVLDLILKNKESKL